MNTTWAQFLFSPSGRFNRARYWGATCLAYGLIALFWLPLLAFDTNDADEPKSAAAVAVMIVAFIVTLAMSLAHVFTTVKRFHDRDKSWAWVLIGLIPTIGGLWILVECGFLGGTRGRNRFGADPLNRGDDDVLSVFDGPAKAERQLAPTFGVSAQDRQY